MPRKDKRDRGVLEEEEKMERSSLASLLSWRRREDEAGEVWFRIPLSIWLTNCLILVQTGRWRDVYSTAVGTWMFEGGGRVAKVNWRRSRKGGIPGP